jgi:hypothetical protein
VSAALLFCFDAQGELLRLLCDVIDFLWKIFKDQVAHLLRLFDWAQLR